MDRLIYQSGQQLWHTIGHMGNQEWLLVALSAVVFGYYCTKMN